MENKSVFFGGGEGCNNEIKILQQKFVSEHTKYLDCLKRTVFYYWQFALKKRKVYQGQKWGRSHKN